MMTPGAAELVVRFQREGRFVLRRSWQIGVGALVLVVVVTAMLIDLAGSSEPRPGYIGLLLAAPVLVIAVIFGVRQLLPSGAVVVDRLGVHFGDHNIAWAEIASQTVEGTPGWRSYRYVRLTLRDGRSVDLPLMLTPSAHDQWLALRHLREESSGR